MWVVQEGGSGCVPALGSAVRCLRVIWSGRRRAVGGALSFHNTHASPAQNTVIGFEFGTNFVLIRSGDLELPQGGCTAAMWMCCGARLNALVPMGDSLVCYCYCHRRSKARRLSL